MSTVPAAPTWSFLRTFRVPRDPARGAPDWQRSDGWLRTFAALTSTSTAHDWRAATSLISASGAAIGEALVPFDEELALWDRYLADLGGDPSRRDWDEFRPLRLSREEDWSDWLGYLVRSSRAGFLRPELTGTHGPEAPPPSVRREEVTVGGSRRADLIVEWEDAVAHVEVKVGDEDFEKTFETGKLLEGHGPPRPWKHFILLPSASLDLWNEASAGKDGVTPIPWDDVAVALRVALLAGKEDALWLAWAYGLCGAIEQKVLGCPPADAPRDLHGLAALRSRLMLMKKARAHGQQA